MFMHAKNMGWNVMLLVYLTIWFVYVAADLRAVFVVRYRSVATSHMLEILSALRRKLLSAVHTN